MISRVYGLMAAVAVMVIIGGAVFVWLDARERAAVERGVQEQVERDISKANQEIATRRATDAKFDKMDARQFCLDAKLEWVFESGQSFCR
jgi:hypothetical protein